MTQFTTKDIALKLNVGDVEAYGFVKVLLKLGIVKQDGTRKSSNGKGKPTNLYSFNPQTNAITELNNIANLFV